MEFNLRPYFNIKKEYFKNNNEVFEKIKRLNAMYLNETYQGNKVAYYYENIKTGNVISYNQDICFYAASSIKILVCLMLFQKAEKEEINLNDEILVTMDDLKQDTGIIKFQKRDTKYTILELIKLTIIESDNTAYLKLVNLVGKEHIRLYGLSLGAEHTMEGKPTDSFGIINCRDMIIYWKNVKEFIDRNEELGKLFKEYLLTPSFKIIADESIENKPYLRKYGSWDVAYHEAGYVNDEFYLIVLTQLNKMDNKENFVNDTAKQIVEINKIF